MSEQKTQLDGSTGFADNIPNAEYQAYDACSASRLGLLDKTPAHCKWLIEHPKEPTPALILGTAIHGAALEPDTFDTRFAAMPEGLDRRTKAGKAAYAELSLSGKAILSADQFATCQNAQQSVWQHPAAKALLDRPGGAELSAIFDDPCTGLHCKARLDAPRFDLETIVDLKTTEDASPVGFRKSIYKWGYHRQAAMYIKACEVLGQPIKRFVIVAVEKAAPYAVAVYQLDSDILEAGLFELEILMRQYAECQAKNNWPSYPQKVELISLDAWMINKVYQQEKEVA